jgi:hypothetical protein
LSLAGNYVSDVASLHGGSGVNTLSSADNVFGFLATENFV